MIKQNLKKFKPRFFTKKKKTENSASVKSRKTLEKIKFPSIYRFITDSFVSASWRIFRTGLNFIRQKSGIEAFWVGIVAGIIIIGIVVVGLDLNKNLLEKQKIEAQREKMSLEIKFWQEVTNKYKGYRDAYFKLALLEYQLGNIDKARVYLKATFNLDPNFEKGRELEKILTR